MAQSTTELVTKYSAMPAGTYREIIDATAETRQTATANNVVIVGQFEKGPVMRPIRVTSPDAAHVIFGNRSTKLEAKGNFGMLMAEHVLEQGPVWIMNIKNINQFVETLQVKKFACSKNEKDALLDETIGTVYDTGKFWKVDPMYGVYGDGAVLSFASVNDSPVTVVIEKYNSKNYMYTIAETKKYNEAYSNDDVDDNDFVNDYLIRVHVFKCDLSKAKLSVQNAFIGDKLNLEKIEQICADKNSQFFATYTGAIGDIIDINGNNLNIQILMNADTFASGVSVAINRDAYAMNGVDLLAKDALIFSESGDALPTGETINRLGHTITPQLNKICVYNDPTNKVGYMFGNCPLKVGSMVANEDGIVRVVNVAYIEDKYALPAEAELGKVVSTAVGENWPVMPDGMPLTSKNGDVYVYPADSVAPGQVIQYDNNKLNWPVREFVDTAGVVQYTIPALAEGDMILSGKLEYTLNGDTSRVEVTMPANTTDADAAILALVNALRTETSAFDADKATVENGVATVNVHQGVQGLLLGSLELTIGTQESSSAQTFAPAAVTGSSTTASNVQTIVYKALTVANDQVTIEGGEAVDIDKDACSEAFGTATQVYQVQFDEAIKSKLTPQEGDPTIGDTDWNTPTVMTINGTAIEVTPFQLVHYVDWSESSTLSDCNAIYGIVSLEKHYVNGTAARQKAVLDRLNDEGILTAFSDPTIFRCRYMCDTFKTYIEPNAKFQYAKLADEAKRFLVFIPAPFYHELRTSKNPDFHDTLNIFRMSYVAAGSNPDKPSTNTFYYSRNGDTGRYLVPVMNATYNIGFGDKVVPATGALCKAFYSKLSGVNKVYDIVAGEDWPISATGITGPEFESGPQDRAAMEKMGTNVLQVVDDILQVRSSKTAYQTVLSAFNYPETMEKCFFVTDNVERTLGGKIFKYNNADSRLAVKKRADSVCDIMVADQVIADYENICDLSNNPIEVRKAGIILLDTVLYNEYGIVIAVHRTTVKDPEE